MYLLRKSFKYNVELFVMQKISKLLFSLFLFTFIASCSLVDDYLDKEEWTDQSDIDYLVGVKESGKLKKELHFSNTDDYDTKSDIEFVYKDNKLTQQIFTDYNWDNPVVIQKDTFLYDCEILCSRVHYLMEKIPTSPLVIAKTFNYYYPDENTKIKVEFSETGEIDDSIVFVYSSKLLIKERHFKSNGSSHFSFEYNLDNKLSKIIDLTRGLTTINYFDENGVLENTKVFIGDEVQSEITYERIVKNNLLTIKRFVKLSNKTDKFLSSVKTFESGILIELAEHHVSLSGAEWWCTRYEYF